MAAGLPFASLYWVSCVASLHLAGRVRKPSSPVERELFRLALASAQWALVFGFEVLASSEEFRLLWSQLAYIGTYATGVLLFRLTVRWLWPDLRGRWLETMWIVPAGIVVLAFTNPLHELIWTDIAPSAGHPALWVYEHGPAFWVGIAYLYALVGASFLAFVWAARRRRGVYRRQALWMMAGAGAPILCNLAYLSSILPFYPLEVTPICLTISVGCFLAGISRAGFLELLPTARHEGVSVMADGWLVVDVDSRIVDWNRAFLSAWGVTEVGLMGREVGEVVPGWTRLPAGEEPKQSRTLLDAPNGRRVEATVRRLFTGGRMRGWICLFHDATHMLRTEGELRAANEQLRTLNDELVRQATHDALTGFYNRHFLDEAIQREIVRAERSAIHLALLMCDIDHFKEINDTLGHAAGDRVLRCVADALRSVVRRGDIPCCFGGDELILLMPNADACVAQGVAERIQREAQAACGEPGGNPASVTLSWGIAVYPDHAESSDELFAAADRALYRSKLEGRNRVTVAGGRSS